MFFQQLSTLLDATKVIIFNNRLFICRTNKPLLKMLIFIKCSGNLLYFMSYRKKHYAVEKLIYIYNNRVNNVIKLTVLIV